jgi:hypothetical protein
MAHGKQMVHIRTLCSHRWHRNICPTKVVRHICPSRRQCQVSSNEAITCFTSASAATTCKTQTVGRVIHNLSDVQPWTAVTSSWHILVQQPRPFVTNGLPQPKCTTITLSRQCHHHQGNPIQAHVYGPKAVCHGLRYWWQCFHFICWGEMTVSIPCILFLVSGVARLTMLQPQNCSPWSG